MSQSPEQLILYVWPSRWNLPSFDPLCLATIMYLQQAIPGKFSIAECNNPDLSPTGGYVSIFYPEYLPLKLQPGQLPFLVHEQHTVSTFGLITKYVAELKDVNNANSNLDASLDNTERSQTVAWCAHVESNLGDIVVS